jgi:tRNA nucleotidyltransferase/poly(A) polymerase
MGFLPRGQVLSWLPDQPDFRKLVNALRNDAVPVFVVGGAVRDFLSGRNVPLSDLDIVTPGPVMPLARRLADQLHWAFYPLDETRDVARLVRKVGLTDNEARSKGATGSLENALVCDIAGLRGSTLIQDLASRDFTVNAMALEITGSGEARLFDPWQGQTHLQDRLLVAVRSYAMAEDPLRLLRAVRMSVQMGFSIAPGLRRQIVELAPKIRDPSPERVRDELWKIFTASSPALAIDELRNLGLWVYILPEVAAITGIRRPGDVHIDAFEHTLRVVSAAEHLRAWLDGKGWQEPWEADLLNLLRPWHQDLQNHFHERFSGRRRLDWLPWFAFLQGAQGTRLGNGSKRLSAAQVVSQRLKQLQFSRNEIDLAQTVLETCSRFHSLHAAFGHRPISRRSCYHFFQPGGAMPGLDALCLVVAEFLATRPRPNRLGTSLAYYLPDSFLLHVRQLVSFAFQDMPLQEHPVVNGRQLMWKYQLEPGPRLGRLLDGLREVQVVDGVNQVCLAYEWVSKWLHEEIRG